MSVLPGSNLPSGPQFTVEAPSGAGPEAVSVGGFPSVSWQRQLAEAIRSPAELLAALNLTPDVATALGSADHEAGRSFATLVPRSFLNRMQPGDPSDPLLLQVLPTEIERQVTAGFVADPVGDAAARRAPGLLQKYHGRALMIATGACAVHCRYCFRREYPYQDEPRQLQDWQPALREIADDSSLTEVILSGGDPLILNDDRLQVLCEAIDAISHVERIRLHTRLPIVLPARVTQGLLTLFTSLRCQAVMVVHANHGNEIVGDCREALQAIVKAGIPVLNQAVLLRNINDTVEALEVLCRRLVNIGVMPYYLHQLDRVQGAAHFEADTALGIQLVKELTTRLPGYAVPKFVQEVAGEASKTAM